MPNTPILTLYELQHRVRQALQTALPAAYWVTAEVSELREVRGHCFMELVQKSPTQSTPLARASAKCWASEWAAQRTLFAQVTGQAPAAGMQMLLLVEAQFHEAYGFSWMVREIDPTFTLGDMARRRREIVEQLRREGVLELQRCLTLPPFCQRIAVISSDQAAGWGDFYRQIMDNPQRLRFHLTLFPATMQGEQVGESVARALDKVFERAEEFDAVVIIRGGGATADLSGFDHLALAEHVANFPLPILTGIGHERDESVLDLVAHTALKTPTAAAVFLVEHLAGTLQHVERLQQRATVLATTRVEQSRQQIERMAQRLPHLASLLLTIQHRRLDRLSAQMQAAWRGRVASMASHTQQLHTRLITAATRQLTQQRALQYRLQQRATHALQQRLLHDRHQLEQLALRAEALNPQRVLQRGYSLTLLNGKAVTSTAQLTVGSTVRTMLANGQIEATVTSILPNKKGSM